MYLKKFLQRSTNNWNYKYFGLWTKTGLTARTRRVTANGLLCLTCILLCSTQLFDRNKGSISMPLSSRAMTCVFARKTFHLVYWPPSSDNVAVFIGWQATNANWEIGSPASSIQLRHLWREGWSQWSGRCAYPIPHPEWYMHWRWLPRGDVLLDNRAVSISLCEFQEEMKSDTTLPQVLGFIGWTWSDDAKTNTTQTPFLKFRYELSSMNGLLIRGDAVVPPASFRPRVITHTHESHLGMVRIQQKLRLKYWWPRMNCEV